MPINDGIGLQIKMRDMQQLEAVAHGPEFDGFECA